jgi:hypothetical protein
MELTRNQSRIGGGLTALLVSLAAIAQSACSSDDSSNPGDASADSSMQVEAAVDAGPPPPLGVPVSSCAGCPVCGGVLGSPTTGITYCTQNCDAGTDCPTGLACVPNQTSMFLRNECIRTCTSNADCTAPFICRSDLVSPGSFCWSPYPTPATPTMPMPDAGTAADAADGAPPADTGAPDAGDGAPSDAGDAGDGS